MNRFKRYLYIFIIVYVVLSQHIEVQADISTALVGRYDFDDNIDNQVNGATANVTGNVIGIDGGEKEPLYVEGVDGGAIWFNGKGSSYGLELIDCSVSDDTYTISYDIYYTSYVKMATVFYMSVMPYNYNNPYDDNAHVAFGWMKGNDLSYAPCIEFSKYHNDKLLGTQSQSLAVEPAEKQGNLVNIELTDDLEQNLGAKWSKWTNFTYVIDGENITVYVDGKNISLLVEDYLNDEMGVSVDTKFYIGVLEKDERLLSAAIDNLYIFDRALLPEDVSELISRRDYTKKFVLKEGMEIQHIDYREEWGIIKSEDDNDEKEENVQQITTNEVYKKVSREEQKVINTTLRICMYGIGVTMVISIAVVLIGVNSKDTKKYIEKNNKSKKLIKISKFFCAKNFMILAFAVFLCVMVCITMDKYKRKKEYSNIVALNGEYIEGMDYENFTAEEETRYNTNRIKEYRKLNSAPENCADLEDKTKLSEVLAGADVSMDNIEGIMIGADIDGKGIERYYITDTAIIEKVLKKVQDMELIRMTNTGEESYEVEPDWDVQICRKNSEYSFRIYGEPTNESEYYRTRVQESFETGYYTEKDWVIEGNAYVDTFGSDKQLLFNSDIEDFLEKIIKDNITELSMETLDDIVLKEEIDMGEIFGYKHTAPLYVSSIEVPGLRAFQFEFPIKDTDCYVILQKQTFTDTYEPAYKMEVLELHRENNDKYIDLLTATKEDILAFIE